MSGPQKSLPFRLWRDLQFFSRPFRTGAGFRRNQLPHVKHDKEIMQTSYVVSGGRKSAAQAAGYDTTWHDLLLLTYCDLPCSVFTVLGIDITIDTFRFKISAPIRWWWMAGMGTLSIGFGAVILQTADIRDIGIHRWHTCETTGCKLQFCIMWLHLGLSENNVPLNPMDLLIIIPFFNG